MDFKLIVLDNFKEVGEKVDKHLMRIYNTNNSFIIPIKTTRFNNGEGKAEISKSIRGKNVYILSDVGNYGITYNFRGVEHIVSPDEHFQDIKRVLSAANNHSSSQTLIMPLLYQSRQDKRTSRESLDCAVALQELEQSGVDNIITFDVHNPGIVNAVPRLPFSNIYATNEIINCFVEKENIDDKDVIVIAPDTGALDRARYYAGMLNSDVGVFYKRRDYSKVVDGKNPVVEHVYLGKDVKDKVIIIVDDMISSGDSMLEVATYLKGRGAKCIYLVATFSLFTVGVDRFNETYKNKIFKKLYTTNLTYIPKEIKDNKWLEEVDCSCKIAAVIDMLNKKDSLEKLK